MPMGSHSVTFHPTEVTFPPLSQPIKVVLDLANPKGCKWVDLVGRLHNAAHRAIQCD